MPERWETELGKLATLEPPPRIRSRVDEGPRGEGVPPMPGRGQRIAAAVVGLAVFAAAAAFALGAFGDGLTVGGGRGEPLVITIDGSARDSVAIFEYGGARLEQAVQLMSEPPQARETFPIALPIGTPIEIHGGNDRWNVAQATGELMSLEDLQTRFPDTATLDPLDGSTIPDIQGTTWLSVSVPEVEGDGSLLFTIVVDVYEPGNGAVAEVPFLNGTMTAPDDGSVPQLQLRYGDVVRSIHPQGGNWLGGPVGWDLVLQSFPAVPLGTQVAFDGDVHEVTATLRYGTTQESPTERLKDGFANLPDVPGEYLIHVTGEWPQGTAEFTFLVSLRDPDALTVSWGDYVHAVFGDQDVELTEIPGGDPLSVDPETLIARTIEVPEGSDIWTVSDADTLAAWLQDDGGSKAPFQSLDFPRRAAVFREAPAGEFFLILQGAQGREVQAYVLRLRIVPSATPTEGVPAPADDLVATLEAPGDGSLPTITLAYGEEEQGFTACGGRWNDVRIQCTLILHSFRTPVKPGSSLVVAGDADAVDGELAVLDQDLRHTDETIALDLAYGSAALPEEQGFYGLSLNGTWSAGTAGLYVVITVGEPEVASPSPLPEIEPGIVPSLIGVGEGDAYKLLDQAGLEGASTVAPVADVANGLVASTDPPAGTRVDAGTTVTLRVSGTTAFGEGVVSALDCPSEDQMPFVLDIEIPPGTSTFHVLTTTQEVGSKPGDVFAAREEQNATGDTVVVWNVIRADRTIAIVADDPLEGVACRGSGFGGV